MQCFPKFDFWLKFQFLTQVSIFDSNCNFWLKYQFLTQISIFDSNINFWLKLQFPIFDQKDFYSWLKFYFWLKYIDRWPKVDVWHKFLIWLKFRWSTFFVMALKFLTQSSNKFFPRKKLYIEFYIPKLCFSQHSYSVLKIVIRNYRNNFATARNIELWIFLMFHLQIRPFEFFQKFDQMFFVKIRNVAFLRKIAKYFIFAQNEDFWCFSD